MRTNVKAVVTAPHIHMEYASRKSVRTEDGGADIGKERERIKEMLIPLVKEAVQRQMKEQQDYYKSRPSLAARQMEQLFGAGSIERALTSTVSIQVYERIEERLSHERLRKGR